MLSKTSRTRRGIALLATAGLAGSLLMSIGLSASADPVTHSLTFEPSDAAGALVVGKSEGAKVPGWFEGASTAIVTPSPTHDGQALEFTKSGQPWSGMVVLGVTDETLTDSTHKTISFDYYSPDATSSPLVLQLERLSEPDNGSQATKKTLVATQGWNTFNVDVTTMTNYDAARTYVKLVMFPNFGTADGATVATSGGKYLLDNVSITGIPTAPPPPPTTDPVKLTFEDDDVTGALAYGTPNGPTKVAGSFIADLTGQGTPPVRHTGKALEFNKASSDADYSGFVVYHAPDGGAISDSTHKMISFEMYSPIRGKIPVQVKLELAPNAAIKMLSASKGWNKFTWDVTTMDSYNPSLAYVNLVVIPDFGTLAGTRVVTKNNQKFYFDNFLLNVNGAVNTVANTISGTTSVGSVLTADTGTWTGTNVTYAYQWYACTSKATAAKAGAPSSRDHCTKLRGQTNSTYTLTRSNKRKYMRVTVKASTLAGDAYKTSASTAKIG